MNSHAVDALTDELHLAGSERVILEDFFTLCLAKVGNVGFSTAFDEPLFRVHCT